MADNKIATELLDKIDVFEHTHVARHIPRSAEISLKYFENSGLSCEYFLDLDEVFIKNKRKVLKFHTPDLDHFYDIFGKYERSQNTVPLASTQAVYKAPHSTVRESHSDTSTQSDMVTVAVGSLRA